MNFDPNAECWAIYKNTECNTLNLIENYSDSVCIHKWIEVCALLQQQHSFPPQQKKKKPRQTEKKEAGKGKTSDGI